LPSWQGAKEWHLVKWLNLAITIAACANEAEIKRVAPKLFEGCPRKNMFCFEDEATRFQTSEQKGFDAGAYL